MPPGDGDRAGAAMDDGIRVGLLGPLEVWRRDRPVRVASALQRMLVARLALDPGRAVAVEVLVDDLWEDRPPADARGALHFLHVKPGETEQLRAAIGRFQDRLRSAPMDYMIKFGLVDQRHVIFGNGTRLCWITAFDTDWDPYIDDSVTTLGLATWVDWAQHTVEYDPEIVTGPAGVKV